MGSHFDFKNISSSSSNGQPPESNSSGGGGTGRLLGNFSLTRQPSVYSLTFEEFQNSMGGLGKDFGSMNMDEFLKNIWTAEETQAMTSAFGGGGGVGVGVGVGGAVTEVGGNLQRQGSLTLPRTLSQKTVDEVWKDLYYKDSSNEGKVGNDSSGGGGGSNLQQRQPTFGEITLEEFLVKAGVVREETQIVGRPNNTTGFGAEFSRSNDNTGLDFGFPQLNRTGGVVTNQLQNQSPNLTINANGVRSSQQQQQQRQSPQPRAQQQPQIFPKQVQVQAQAQATVTYAPPLHLANSALVGSPGMRGGVVGIVDPAVNHGFVTGGGMGMVGLGGGAVGVASGSPANQLSTDGLARSNGDTSSLSPVPYAFNGGLRGRKRSGAVEKVVERRQRRMIKNRESAARSRARKQAYTMELEAEVAKLKEENQKLQDKQAEIMEMQKNQVLEMMNQQRIPKRRCLRRTQTGPW